MQLDNFIKDTATVNTEPKVKQLNFPELVDIDYLKSFKEQKGQYLCLYKLFGPYLSMLLKRYNVINYTTLDNFKKKFNINSNILDPMKAIWDINPYAILAGGKLIDFFNNKNLEESLNDYDIFNGNLSTKQRKNLNGKNIINLPYLEEYEIDGHKFQFMSKTYNETEEIIESFDFRCCAICANNKYIWWIKGALQDNRDKKLIFLNPHESLTYNLRLEKYIKKGYTISQPDFMIAAIKSIDAIITSTYVSDYKKEKTYPQITNRNHIFDRKDIVYEEWLNNCLEINLEAEATEEI